MQTRFAVLLIFVIRKLIKTVLIIILIPILTVIALNLIVVLSTAPKIVSAEEATAYFSRDSGGGKADCILILGASVKTGRPSEILANRLDAGIEVFADGGSDLFLLSGDSMAENYSEAKAMESYVLENGAAYGVSGDNIYLDYSGFSTYESVKRAKDVFGAKKIVIVTQRYHLYRALFIAKTIGLDAVGVAAEDREYGQWQRDLREIPARVKDFFMSLAEVVPPTIGDPVAMQFPSTQDKP